MSYTEQFSRQWDSLVANFICDMGKLPAEEITLKKLYEWYRAKSFCWSSMVEHEGLVLRQLDNQKLEEDLLRAIDNFEFKEITPPKKPSAAWRIAIGVGVGVVLGGLCGFFTAWKIWLMVIVALICIMASVFSYAGSLDKYAKMASSEVCEKYAAQLKEYKETLLAVCRKYE